MYIHLEDDEHIALTLLEIRILVALAAAHNTSTGIGRSITRQTGLSTRISQGSLLPALKRLEQIRLVSSELVIPRAGHAYTLYRLASIGEIVLEWRLKELQKLCELGQEYLYRLQTRAR
jgi:DNA-binding PadR family transcriptional regulator